MRKVSKITAQAFKLNQSIKMGNSKVNGGVYYLHGNRIASIDGDGLLNLSDCGWKTSTTKERLNAILEAMRLPYCIYQKSFNWFVRNVITNEVIQFNGGMTFDVATKTVV